MPEGKTKADLETEMAALQKRLAEIEGKLNAVAEAAKPPAPFVGEPYRPIDYTSRASMPVSAMRDLASAIPPDLARDLRADLARGNPATQSQSLLSQDRGGAVERGTGYRDAVPLTAPAGVAICDRIMDTADEIDRRDLERRLGVKNK